MRMSANPIIAPRGLRAALDATPDRDAAAATPDAQAITVAEAASPAFHAAAAAGWADYDGPRCGCPACM